MTMRLSLIVVVLLFTLHFCNGQRENDTENCFMWYYDMPRSIECREGTHFSIPCQVRVSCDIKAEVDWYWNPLNKSNTTLLITDSSSNGTRVRALSLSQGTCNLSATEMIDHFYTLTLERLNYDHVGYYWCQLRVDNSSAKSTGDLLPSNQCYVSVGDTVKNCEYREHYDRWMCAQKPSAPTGGIEEDLHIIISPTQTTIQNSPLPTVTVDDKGPTDNGRDNPFSKMPVSIIEAAFLVTIIICTAIIVILICCLFHKYRKRRDSGSTVEEMSAHTQKQRSSEGNASVPDGPNPRYAPVSTLTHAFSVPHLASGQCRHHPIDNTGMSKEPIYSSHYQHLNTESMDYTSMYSKPHQYTEITVGKSPHSN